MLVFRFQERYILHFFPPKKRRNSCLDYLVLVLRQALDSENIFLGSFTIKNRGKRNRQTQVF
jgi:hypothetical protein